MGIFTLQKWRVENFSYVQGRAPRRPSEGKRKGAKRLNRAPRKRRNRDFCRNLLLSLPTRQNCRRRQRFWENRLWGKTYRSADPEKRAEQETTVTPCSALAKPTSSYENFLKRLDFW